ncbi:MAG: LysM peptidoglycan-binding domain-containing protein [Planctomycetota bacterium]
MADSGEKVVDSVQQQNASTGWYVLFVLSVVIIGYFALRTSLLKEPEETKVTDHGSTSYDAWGRSSEVVARTLGSDDDTSIDMGVGPSGSMAVNEVADSVQTPPVVQVQPSVVTPATERTYVVQPGDVLGEISRKMYGTTRHSNLILKANPAVKDPDFLKVGMTLKIPTPPASSTPVSVTQVDSAEYIIYTVVKDDSPWVIAEKFYGKGHLNTLIMQDNPDRFKDGKSLIKPGDQIRIRRSKMKQP